MSATTPTKTPVALLQELTVKHRLPHPHYKLTLTKSGTHHNQFDTMVSVAGTELIGSGPNKQISKQRAAYKALQSLKDLGLYNPEEDPVDDFEAPLPPNSSAGDASEFNYINDLREKCSKRGLPHPSFFEVLDDGPSHAKRFAFECHIGSTVKKGESCPTKKMAKQMAAYEILNIINEIETQPCKNGVEEQIDGKTQAAIDFVKSMERIDKTIKPTDIKTALCNRMKEKNIKYDDLKCDLNNVSEESLKRLLEKLQIDYKLQELQKSPIIVELSLKFETTFVLLGWADNYEAAKEKVIDQLFMFMKLFLGA